jgi:hypothetical protein
MTTYHEIRGQVEPFDIFLFSGKGLISKGIQLFTGSPWSHVGLSLRLPGYDFNLLYESTTLSNTPDLTTGAKIKGVQLSYLSQRIKNYDGAVGWRHINGSRPADIYDTAAAFVREYEGRPYEENQIELIRSALDITKLWQNQPDMSSVFCSELSAHMLRRVSFLEDNEKPANEFTPADFADEMKWMNGYTVDEVVDLL